MILYDYKTPEEHKANILKEILYLFKNGRKNSLVNPEFASLRDMKSDGLEPSVTPEAAFVENCARIGAFLMDHRAFLAQLKKLNALLASVLTPERKVKEFRILLEKELTQAGFFPGFGKTFGNIPPDVFRAATAHGLMLKDAILGNENHGEFTHPIQWLMIAWQQRDTGFLDETVISLFKQLGHEKAVFSRQRIYVDENPLQGRNEYNIWDLIIDRLDDANDFRQPSYLHMMLLKTENPELSLLKEMITKRVRKRTEPGAIDCYKGQFNKPHNFYHISRMPLLHEPEGSDIDWQLFRKNGYGPP